jgi:hypothetical protein
MKFLCRALCVLLIANCAFGARVTEESLNDFEPLDDDLVLYIPKFAVKLGFRGLDGATSSFGGSGVLSSNTSIGQPDEEIQRLYHDGYVAFDQRKVVDPAGNTVPITPDGRTNTWGFRSQTQARADGLIAMHAYSATTTDSGFAENDPPATFGVELSLEREFGSVFGTRMKWGVVGGVSINQISSEFSSEMGATVTTVTDLYSLGGQAAPTAPFTGPAAGGLVDNTPLLGSQVLARETQSAPGVVLSNWKLRGAYLSFRVGPTLFVPITERFSATFSAGGVMVFSGTTFDVAQSFVPATGDTIAGAMTSDDTALMPGYYVDASLQFAMTDTAGLYLGAVYQSTGDYTQDVASDDELAKYSTRVDLSALQGIRAGVSFKF